MGGYIMFARDVLRILGITRQTLTKYVKTGTIRVTVLPNKRYVFFVVVVTLIRQNCNSDCTRLHILC